MNKIYTHEKRVASIDDKKAKKIAVVIIGSLVAVTVLLLGLYGFYHMTAVSRFEKALRSGEFEKASTYYNTEENREEKEKLHSELMAYLAELDVYISGDGFDGTVFDQRFGGLSAFDAEIGEAISKLMDKTVSRFENYTLTYEKAKEILHKLAELTKGTVEIGQAMENIESIYQSQQAVENATSLIEQGNNQEALQMLIQVKQETENSSYLAYKADEQITLCIEQMKSDANSLAVDGKYAEAIAILQNLLKQVDDEEARAMISRIYSSQTQEQ